MHFLCCWFEQNMWKQSAPWWPHWNHWWKIQPASLWTCSDQPNRTQTNFLVNEFGCCGSTPASAVGLATDNHAVFLPTAMDWNENNHEVTAHMVWLWFILFRGVTDWCFDFMSYLHSAVFSHLTVHLLTQNGRFHAVQARWRVWLWK